MFEEVGFVPVLVEFAKLWGESTVARGGRVFSMCEIKGSQFVGICAICFK